MKHTWWIFLIFLSAMLFCIINIRESKKAEHNAANAFVASSAGVVLHGGAGADNSWIENTTDHLVVIKQINQSNGDRTLAIFALKSGEKKDVKIEFNDGFIITQVVHDWNLEVGFISANPPKKSSLFRTFEEVFDAKESSMA